MESSPVFLFPGFLQQRPWSGSVQGLSPHTLSLGPSVVCYVAQKVVVLKVSDRWCERAPSFLLLTPSVSDPGMAVDLHTYFPPILSDEPWIQTAVLTLLLPSIRMVLLLLFALLFYFPRPYISLLCKFPWRVHPICSSVIFSFIWVSGKQSWGNGHNSWTKNNSQSKEMVPANSPFWTAYLSLHSGD